ncbi:amino acid adenylation domain-containing protein [Kribbella sp. NBC_00889]|uniref:amino acid adenylation domain-containing protein n=1 Tax=Kribbella sp. NBC_00889 TaxID=2975974 RepID=UPI00386C3F96|nr:amino acid adenylation domain-containing protein [Kribbella sp. NBC_00889]
MVRSGVDRPAISTGPALMIPAGYPRDLPSALLRAARDFGGAGVVEIGPDGRETKLDFPTLLELAARILAGLRANGVRAGDPAVVHCTEPVGFFAAFWACTLGGIRPLLMAPSPEGDRSEEGRERLRKLTDLLGWTVLIGRPSDLPDDLGLPVLDPDALAGHEPTSEFHRPAADDVAVLMMSSGTSTGAPKIVQLTHRGLVEFAAGTPAMLPVRPGQTTLNWLPLTQSGAFLLYHLLPVFTGCTNVHVNTDWLLADPLRWLDLMDQHRVNHSWSPNFGYRLATQAIAGEPDRHWDLSALRSLVSGGEQITVPVMSEFLRLTNRFGVVPETFVAAWGMTETVTGITFARPGLTPNVHRVRIPPTGVIEWVDQRPATGKVAVARPGKTRAEAPGVLSLVSVGAPAPGTTVRIVAPNGAVLPEGRIGQLQVASARVTPGYLGNLEADRAAFPIGNWPARKWLATGDQAFITGGQVVITGRDSERIIMAGKLYYAHDIESVAATVVGAEQGLVAACGIADGASGTDRLVVFYALTPESIPGMDQAIRSLVLARLGLEAEVIGVPRRDFPTTPGGKILRPLLKQRWIDGTLETPPHPYVEPAGANSYSGPAGEGPHANAADTLISAEEDPAERTTELPVVRLAWKRTLQHSIPTPPQRPTLGTPTSPVTADPTADAPTEPEPAPIPDAEQTTELQRVPATDEPRPPAQAKSPSPTEHPAEALAAEAQPHPEPIAELEPTAELDRTAKREPTEEASEQAAEPRPESVAAVEPMQPVEETPDEPAADAHPQPEPTAEAAEPTAEAAEEPAPELTAETQPTDPAEEAADEPAAEAQAEPETTAESEPTEPAEEAADEPAAEAQAEPETTAESEPTEPAEEAADEPAAEAQAEPETTAESEPTEPAEEAADEPAAEAQAEPETTAESEPTEPAEEAADEPAAEAQAEPETTAESEPTEPAEEAADEPAAEAQAEPETTAESEPTEPAEEAADEPAAEAQAEPETTAESEPTEPADGTAEELSAEAQPQPEPSVESESTEPAERTAEEPAAEAQSEPEVSGEVGSTEPVEAAVESAVLEVPLESADGTESVEPAAEAPEEPAAEAPARSELPAARFIARYTITQAPALDVPAEDPTSEPAAKATDPDQPQPAAEVGADEQHPEAELEPAAESEPTADEQQSEAEPVAEAESEAAGDEQEPETELAAGGEAELGAEAVALEQLEPEASQVAGGESTGTVDQPAADATSEEIAEAEQSGSTEELAAEAEPVEEVPAEAAREQEAAQEQEAAREQSAVGAPAEAVAVASVEAASAAEPVEDGAAEQVAEAGQESEAAPELVASAEQEPERTTAQAHAEPAPQSETAQEPRSETTQKSEPRSESAQEAELAPQSVTAQGAEAAPQSESAVVTEGSRRARQERGSRRVVEPVAVVGLAGRFPGAETLEQFWDNLVGGVESLRRFTNEEVSQAGGHVDDELVAVSGVLDHVESFDAKFFGLSDREAELMDPAQRLFLEVCYQALEHGGYAGTTGRVGVFAGSGMNLYTQQHQSRDSLATRVAYRLGLTGPAIGVQSAWSSSLVAVHLACQALRSGDADLALAGAAAVQVPQATGYHPAPESILSPRGQVRAFDAAADGTVGGNGVAAVLLKRLDQAVADGDTVYAVIRGTAVSNEDAPSGNQVELIERALERSGFAADSLSYIEANAIGSAAADSAEVKSLTTALRRHTDKVGFCTIGSVKPNIGHLDSAAGMAGLIKTILMLQHRMLVPTINYTEPNAELGLDGSPFVIGTEAHDWEAGTTLRAGVSALDAGGTNAQVILEEAPRQIRRGDDGPVVLPLSAPDPDALADLVELFRTDLGHGTGHRLIDLAGTAALGRPPHRHRIAVAGASEAELVDALGSAQATEVPRGGPGPLGYAFTGQGAARRGMAAALAARFPVFRSVLDECDRVYAEETGGSLLELLLTPAGASEGVWPTETAQPALFAFELALARLWQSFGVQPALVVGHSVGEYAALCVAGALSLADGVRLTAKRGELMQRGTVPGAMVAVRADADRVRELTQTPGVEIAAGNGPQSFVLTGSEVIVGQLAEQLDRLEVAYQRLDVDRAFHSSLVDPILKDFAAIVREITLKPLRTPMVSSWSGDLLESGTVLDGDYLVGQLRQPVLFGDAVEAVTAAGCRRFLELGPDAVLSPAGRRIAPNSTWIPAQRLGQDPVLATMNGLAELYEQGTEIAWSKVYSDGGRVPLPTYPFRRVHHPVDTSAAGLASDGAGRPARVQPSPFERAARAQAVVFEPSSAAVKRIPLDPPAEPEVAESNDPVEEQSPFALPAETHQIDADYLARAGVLSGDEMSAERYRDSLDLILDLTCEALNLDPYDLTVDHTFAELGARPDSMAPVITEINSRFEVTLTPEDLFSAYTTPHKLATAVATQTPEALEAEQAAVAAQPENTAEALEASEDVAVEAVAEKAEDVAAEASAEEAEVEPPAEELEETAQAESVEGAPARDARTALADLGSGLAELAAKVDEAAAATSEAELPGNGMAVLMSQQLRVAGQLVDGVTKLMREQLALLEAATSEDPTTSEHFADPSTPAEPEGVQDVDDGAEAVDAVQADAPAADPTNAPDVNAEVQAEARTSEDVERLRRDLGYWEMALAGAEPLVLVADGVRPAASGAVGSVKKEFEEELGDAVFVFSRGRKVSPLMTMLAAVGTVLGRFAAQDDVTIGTALIRPQGDTSTAARRALPIRIDLSGEPDLGELAHRVRDVTAGAFDHAGTDLAVLERDPLFQVLVEFEDGDEELPEPLDLRLRLTHHGAGITCTADYRSGLFEQRTIDRLVAYLEAVLRRATTQPNLRLPDLMFPIESDLEALRELEGDTAPAGPIGRVRRDAVVAGELSGLHTLFEQQVARTPDATALIQGERELTYAELDRRANALAWRLVDLGVKPGQLVAVRVARGTELVVAVLAVLKSGAAYLPLDPGVPESRWAFMVADSSAVALVGDDAALADRLGLRLVPVTTSNGDARARQAPPVRAAADDVAYCIYTSGSTGNPKGVVVPHRGPVNLIRHYLRTRSSLRTLQWTSFGFDVHVQEMFTALASGSALVLIGEDDRYDPDAVIAALRDHDVERLFMAFSPLTALLATMRRLPELPALREIVAGGEAMVLTHKVRDFLEAHPECRLFNEYGQVEASIVTTIHEVNPAVDRPSIGRPGEGVVVRLLDQVLRPVPVGAVGEIHLGGPVVAQGYIGRPEETEHAFVPDPGHPGARLYRSRDLGRWRADGTLEYLGRADDQVKIRGHRVEPGETEHVLADQPGVVDAVVVACADPTGDTCLLGYVVLEDSDPAVLARLMLDLTKELPIYLVPADLIPIEELPLDDNGRLDRTRLPEPEWLTP